MKKILLLSNNGNPKYEIEIFPISICGSRDLTHNGDVIDSKGCQIDDNHDTAGGRYQQIFDVPQGFQKLTLTRGERWSVEAALGNEADNYILPDTVHGVWKIKCNQGAVIVKQ